jgi:DivIVA domain-containing protein
MVTPDEIENRVFGLVRRGYDPSEVDEFLKEVAAALARAQGGLATPAVEAEHEDHDRDLEESAEAVVAGDDFSRLGEEVAAILRQAHESVETLRQRAEGDAALIRQMADQEAAAALLAAQAEAATLRAEADADRTQAARIREATDAEVAVKLAELERRVEAAARAAHEEAKSRARDAVDVQRNVRGRLEETRGDIDNALGHLVGEDDELFSAIDLTELQPEPIKAEVTGPEPRFQSAPVAPPAGPILDLTNDLPWAREDAELGKGEGLPEVVTAHRDDGNGGEPGGATTEGHDEPGDGDLDTIVRDAVEDALRRRKGPEPPIDG